MRFQAVMIAVAQGQDALPGGDDRGGPGPGSGDLEGLAAPAVHESASRVEDAPC